MRRPQVAVLLWLPLVINAVYIPWNRKLLDATRDSLDFENGHEPAHTCIECPPGTHLSRARETPGTKSICLPCTDGVDYTEHKNCMPYCLPCSRCKLGQEEASRCSTTRNTECRCKKDTYCPPDHPCEACIRCRTSCPEGEVLISPCNATADAQCGKPTGPPAIQDHKVWIIPLVVVIVFAFIFILILYCVRKKLHQKLSTGGRSASLCGSYTSAIQMLKRYHHNSHTQETRDNHANSSRDRAANLILPREEDNEQVAVQDLDNHHLLRQPMDNRRPNGANKISYDLIPVDGNEAQVLQDSFNVFVEYVPTDSWSFFMRKLGLTNNEITIVQADYNLSGMQEVRYQMLRKWHDHVGTKGSVNTLLHALNDVQIGHVSETISAKLLERNLYKPLQAS